MHYYESDEESRLQLVFVSGGLNPEIWKQQIRYFSKKFKTVSFRPTVSFRDYEGEKSALKNILDQEHLDNVVLISHVFGNPLAQEFESHESVVSTVMTSPRRAMDKKPNRKLLEWFYRISGASPKLTKKFFFSERTEYRVVKEFLEDIETPSANDFKTFIDNYSVARPEKDSLVLHPDSDRLSNVDFGKELKPYASLSVLQNSGTFCFYEKPQEYNKALHDFLEALQEDVKSEEIIETREKNRSLFEFEEQSRSKSSEEGKLGNKEVRRKVKV